LKILYFSIPKAPIFMIFYSFHDKSLRDERAVRLVPDSPRRTPQALR
jgi:hypothetical protein